MPAAFDPAIGFSGPGLERPDTTARPLPDSALPFMPAMDTP
jgi:hypothetical protein